MKSRIRSRKKSIREHTPDVSTAPAPSMFQSRPFVVRSPSAKKSQQQPDLKTSLIRAERYGHHLSRMHPTDLSAPNAVQPKFGKGQQDESERAKAPQVLQAKLSVGAPGDMYEQEADVVAATVVDRIHGGGERSPAQEPQEPAQSQSIQPRQKKKSSQPLGLNIQPLVQRESARGVQEAKPHLEQSIQQKRAGGQPLSNNIQKQMGRSFGADFSGVKVHTDGQSDKLNQSIQAKAFTTGQDIFFRQGAYDPGSRGGQELIAHELTHVVQQQGSAVQRQPFLSRTGQKQTTETEGTPTSSMLSGSQNSHTKNPVVQRQVYQDIVNNWADGDKIYGLNSGRQETVEALDKVGKNDTIIDDLNNQFVGTGKVGDPKYPKTYDENIHLNSPEASDFKQALESHPKYDPRLVPNENVSLTRVKRSCKGGIEFVKTKGKTLHFILDKIDMNMVITKTGPYDEMKVTAEGDKSRDITGAELRYLYRHKNNADLMNNVKFWKEGKRVEAPWVTHKEDWDKNYTDSQKNVEKVMSTDLVLNPIRKLRQDTLNAWMNGMKSLHEDWKNINKQWSGKASYWKAQNERIINLAMYQKNSMVTTIEDTRKEVNKVNDTREKRILRKQLERWKAGLDKIEKMIFDLVRFITEEKKDTSEIGSKIETIITQIESEPT